MPEVLNAKTPGIIIIIGGFNSIIFFEYECSWVQICNKMVLNENSKAQ